MKYQIFRHRGLTWLTKDGDVWFEIKGNSIYGATERGKL